MRRVTMTLMLAAALLMACAAPAMANMGVGTDTGKIVIDQPLAAGGRYPIAPFGIFNAGDTAYGYQMKIAASNKKGMIAPQEWFEFEPSAFYLKPQQNHQVATTLVISADATPGVYAVQLQGSPKIAFTETPGGRLNVGAGPVLTFTVAQPGLLQKMLFAFTGFMPWSALLLVGIAVAIGVGVWLLTRPREPKTAEVTVQVVQEPLPLYSPATIRIRE